MMRQFELVELVRSYDPKADEAALNRAYVYSMKAHGAQLRASGDPYFSHPIEVAGLLAQMKLDSASIVTGLGFLREKGGDIVSRIVAELKDTLAEGGLAAAVSGREKSPYSIWRKMQRKNVSFEQLADVMAFRVLVDDAGACYHGLGIIHSAYHVVPGRFKDFISTPKPNNYRSLHTAMIGPEKQRIEVQIRTREMHDVAELGVAAHWTYKHGAPTTEGPQYRWLRELVDILA